MDIGIVTSENRLYEAKSVIRLQNTGNRHNAVTIPDYITWN
jgi:hypothetical protein